MAEEQERKKIWEMIKDIRFATLVSRDDAGRMHARPMAAANKSFDGELWFFTSRNSAKLREIAVDPNVLVSYSEPKTQTYLSLLGRAEEVRDAAKIHELWSEPVRVWFPKGETDPDITLLKVTVESAEYWDSPSAALVQIYGYVKARITGERPGSIAGDHQKVNF